MLKCDEYIRNCTYTYICIPLLCAHILQRGKIDIVYCWSRDYCSCHDQHVWSWTHDHTHVNPIITYQGIIQINDHNANDNQRSQSNQPLLFLPTWWHMNIAIYNLRSPVLLFIPWTMNIERVGIKVPDQLSTLVFRLDIILWYCNMAVD